jgi:hypothetical protein
VPEYPVVVDRVEASANHRNTTNRNQRTHHADAGPEANLSWFTNFYVSFCPE